MKRLQIMFDENLYEVLDRRVNSEGISKAELIRKCVREVLKPLPPLPADPIAEMVGVDDFDPAPIDCVVCE
jgi:hypothetical protein